MNTAVELLYRDACNYKATSTVIFIGPPDPHLVERLEAAYDDGEWIVPEQVALTHPARVDFLFSRRFPDQEEDHGFSEIASIEATSAPSTDPRTFAQFVVECEVAGAEGWDPDIAIGAAGGWTDPTTAGRLRAG